MTWEQFARTLEPRLSNAEIDYLLWEQTAFPCAGIKTTVYQLRQAVRAYRRHITLCHGCGHWEKYHKGWCPLVRAERKDTVC